MKFKIRRYFLYYLMRVGAFFLSRLPRRVGLPLAAKAGAAAYLILVRYRGITIDNLKAAFGREKTEREIGTIARRVFENLGKNAFELVKFPELDSGNIDRFVDIENRDILDGALERGRGAIIVTGHFGNWELIPATISLKGYFGAVIGRRIYFHKYDVFLNGLRRLHNVNIIYRDESPRKALKVLKENGIIGILADQDVDSVDGVFVNFFGREAYTPTGPAALAMASGAALIPAFILRENGRHRLVFESPIELADTGDRHNDIAENTLRWSSVIESYVRRYPDHWVWMHRRWKTKSVQSPKLKAQSQAII